ncbi:4-alpha-glucanotransferase [Streptacidiphilus sp. PAMC 29251]
MVLPPAVRPPSRRGASVATTSQPPADPAVATPSQALTELARAHGVDTVRDGPEGRVAIAPDTLVAVLAALDVDASTPDAAAHALERLHQRRANRLLPRHITTRAGQAHDLTVPGDTEVWIEFEDGRPARSLDRHPATGRIPGDLPPGRHTLCARRYGGASAAPLLVAPARLPGVRQRSWGLLAQLYSVLSQRSWGMGDLGDLADLAQWAGLTHGAGFVQVNPLHAGVPATPGQASDPSPYRPSSRRFADPVHLRIEAVPEYAYLAPAAREQLAGLAQRGAALRDAVLLSDGLIDRDATWALKHQALTVLHQVVRSPGREAAYHAFLRREGTPLDRYATWCALAEVHGPAWHSWPSGLRDPGSAAVRRAAAELADRVEFHRWLSWLVDDQLASAQSAAVGAGMTVGLIHDLAVGCHPEGADAWALQDCLATGISIGAPPDAFNAHGQDWGLPPWRPDTLADVGYAPYAGMLRGVVRHAGALRIDHVMGLFRLWWVPEGRPPTEGTYVRYDQEAMLGILALEAERAGAVVIGEDLGTVEPGVREQLADRGILGTSVLWFERDYEADEGGAPLPPERWREQCLATLTTHDLPSTAARLSGEHVELRHRLGLLARPLAEEQAEAESDVEEWLGELAREGLLSVSPYGEGPAADVADPVVGEVLPETVAALHRYLLRTPAELVGVWLPDALGDPRPQNLPGTSSEYPNWRLPLADATGSPTDLEHFTASRRTAALAAVMNEPRDGSAPDPAK